MGESEPLDRYELTHGICAACETGFARMYSDATRDAAMLFRRLVDAGSRGDPATAREFALEAAALGLGPSELLLGLVQPALYGIGERWERGEITVEDEHRFTAWCETLYGCVEKVLPKTGGGPRIVLACVEGNAHSLGVLLLAAHLRGRDRDCVVLPPGLAAEALAEACAREGARIVGLSVSLDVQRAAAEAAGAALLALPDPPRVVFGGLSARRRPIPGFANARTAHEFDEALVTWPLPG
jgi:methanogenic corrinoid protein MtbC1